MREQVRSITGPVEPVAVTPAECGPVGGVGQTRMSPRRRMSDGFVSTDFRTRARSGPTRSRQTAEKRTSLRPVLCHLRVSAVQLRLGMMF